MCGSYPFCSCGIASTRNVFFRALDVFQILRDQVFLNSLFYSLHQDSTLNAFHGGQALATALKLNDTVVDINLANNRAMRQWRGWGLWTHLRWVDRWWLWPAGHWLTLTLSHFSNSEWMDVVAAIHQSKMFSLWLDERHVFGRQWRPSSARTQPSSVWTWSAVKSVMLGWRPGVVMWLYFAAAKGSRAEGSRGWT